MSNKTMKQRIALVAASALTAGFLSVVSMPAANAADGDITVRTTAATGSSGILVALAGTAGSSDQTITISDNGQLTLSLDTSTTGSADVSGPCIFKISSLASNVTTGTTTIAGSGKTVSNTADESTFAIVAPTGGAGTCVVNAFETSAEKAAGTVEDKLVITVSLAGTSNAFSASKSEFSVETTAQAASNNVDATYTGASGTGTFPGTTVINGGKGYFGFQVQDGNNVDLSGHVVGANSTGTCLVGAAAAGTFNAASSTSAASYFQISQSVANAPATCTVTLSVNGVVAASRTFTIQGELASIKATVLPARVKSTSSANAAAVFAMAYDSAGNELDNVALAPDTSLYNSNFTTLTTITTSPKSTSATANSGDITCINKSKGNKLKFKSTNASAVSISSPEYTFDCAGDPANYTASLDKASYVPGDIATLTITAKDSAGALTNDYAALNPGALASKATSIAGSNMTAVKAATDADTFTNGVATYKFIVGSTEGSYQLAVDLPYWNSATYSQTAITVPYAIKASSASVSNADVLKSIVALIASINKQIQALQKLILARK